MHTDAWPQRRSCGGVPLSHVRAVATTRFRKWYPAMLSILDADPVPSEQDEEDAMVESMTPTDPTPLPVYVPVPATAPMAYEAPQATISPWYARWVALAMRAFSPLKLMLGA